MISVEAVKTLSWEGVARVSEGEGQYQITVEACPNRHVGQHYAVRRGRGKFSIAHSPERAMHYVRQHRGLGKR